MVMWFQLFATIVVAVVVILHLKYRNEHAEANEYLIVIFAFAVAFTVQLVCMGFVRGLIRDNKLVCGYVEWLDRHLPEITEGKKKWPQREKDVEG